MTMAGKRLGVWWAIRTVLLVVFYTAYGVFFLLRSTMRLARRLWWGGRLLHQTIACPYCRYEVPLVGRYLCSSPGCGAEYQGFIQKCNICGSGCLWTPCPRCNASVQVGMRI